MFPDWESVKSFMGVRSYRGYIRNDKGLDEFLAAGRSVEELGDKDDSKPFRPGSDNAYPVPFRKFACNNLVPWFVNGRRAKVRWVNAPKPRWVGSYMQEDDFVFALEYRGWPIAEWSSEGVTVRDCGWMTVTTKRRINEVLTPLGLKLVQQNFSWGIQRREGGRWVTWKSQDNADYFISWKVIESVRANSLQDNAVADNAVAMVKRIPPGLNAKSREPRLTPRMETDMWFEPDAGNANRWTTSNSAEPAVNMLSWAERMKRGQNELPWLVLTEEQALDEKYENKDVIIGRGLYEGQVARFYEADSRRRETVVVAWSMKEETPKVGLQMDLADESGLGEWMLVDAYYKEYGKPPDPPPGEEVLEAKKALLYLRAEAKALEVIKPSQFVVMGKVDEEAFEAALKAKIDEGMGKLEDEPEAVLESAGRSKSDLW